MSGAEFDDDVTVDVDEALLARIRADAARRAAGLGDDEVSGGVDASPEGTDDATRDIEDEVLESLGGGESEEDIPTIDGYGALREIGRGGFSRVYEALQFEFQRWVAIKVLTERLESAEEIADFERECRLTGVLSRHPNIVTVLASALTEEQRPCIVMELFPHGSYLNILKRTGPLGLEDLLSLAVRISGALATAHRQGMVHGDVKPQNIFRSEFGSAALGDFGIATLMHQRTEAAKTRLSLYYAAPELVDSGISATSPFADQYSLAATIYTLATGLRPFESEAGDTTGQLLARMLSEPSPRLGKEFPASLDDALSQAMAREPQDRHRDVVAFAAAIAKVEQELGLRPTEIPLVRDSGRYVGETPGSDRPRPTTGSRSQDTPMTPPSAAHPHHAHSSSREVTGSGEDAPDAVSQTVVRPIMPMDTGTQPSEPEQPDEKPRIPLLAKIGSAVAAIAAVVAIVVVVTTDDGEAVDDSVAPPATSAVGTDSTDSAVAAEDERGADASEQVDEPGTGSTEPPDDESGGDGLGSDESDLVPVPPTTTTVLSAPTGLRVREHYRRLSVAWDEPDSRDFDISGYVVELHTDEGKEDERRIPVDRHEVEFTELDSGREYEVRLFYVVMPGELEFADAIVGSEHEVSGPAELEAQEKTESVSIQPASILGVPLDRIAFVTINTNNQSDIYYVDFSVRDLSPSFDSQVRVTDSAVDEGSPSWSPDGRWIAFHRRTDTGKRGYLQVFIHELETRQDRQLVCGSDNGGSPSWAPDGNHIVFTQGISATASRPARDDLLSIDIQADQDNIPSKIKVLDGTSNRRPRVSPDGNHVAFVRGDFPYRTVRVLHLHSESKDVDTPLSGEDDYASPDWSPAPGANKIAYAVRESGSDYRHIYTGNWYALDALSDDPVFTISDEKPVTRGTYKDDEPSWSPDGRWIAFTRQWMDEDGQWSNRDIYVVNTTEEGAEPVPLIENGAFDYRTPSWAPNTDLSVTPTFACA